MKKQIICILMIGIFLLVNCQKKNTTEPTANNAHPQVDIPWPSLADSPWPIARGNMQCTSRSSYRGPRQGIVEWVFNDSLDRIRNGTSAPVIGEDGTIYFTTEYDFHEHRLYAINPNGSLRWFFTLDDNAISTPMVGADDIVYIGCCNGIYYAFYSDGSIKWKYKIAAACFSNFSDAMRLDGTIFCTDFNGILYALNSDGTLKWQTFGKNGFQSDPYHSIVISPDGNTIYVTGLDTTLNALDSQSGSIIFQFDLGGNTWFRSPIVDTDGNIYIIIQDTLNNKIHYPIVSINSNGQFRWKTDQNAYPFAPLYMDHFGNIYFITGDSLCSINYDGKLRWAKDIRINDAHLSFFPLVGDNEGVFYCALNHNYVISLNRDGNILFECEILEPTGGLITGAISSNRRLFVCGKYQLICIK